MAQSYLVTRYRIEGDNGRFWNGHDFSRDEDDIEIFVCADEAQEVADEVGGDVIEFGCFRSIPDAPRGPVLFLAAAE